MKRPRVIAARPALLRRREGILDRHPEIVGGAFLVAAQVALRNLADHPRPAGAIPVLLGNALAFRLELLR